MADISDLGLLVGRVCLGAVYLASGFDKLLHRADAVAELEALRLPQPQTLRYAVIAVQLVGGLMVVLGVSAAWGAAMLLAFTALATLMAHRPQDHQGAARRMQITIALEHLAICGGFVMLMVAGSGRYSLDALMR